MLVKRKSMWLCMLNMAQADIGVVGRDVIMEKPAGIFCVMQLLDLQFGKCRFAVAAPEGWHDDLSRPSRVATTLSPCY